MVEARVENRRLLVGERVAGGGVFELGDCDDLAGHGVRHLRLLLAGELERQPGLLRDPDRAVRALVRAHPAEKEQVLADLRLARVELQVERVRTVACPVELRHRVALIERDRDQADGRGEPAKPFVDEPGVAL